MNKNDKKLGVVKHNKKKKKKTGATNTQTLVQCDESKKLVTLSQNQDPLAELFAKVKAKVEFLKAAGTTNADNIDVSTSTPGKNTKLESLPQKQDPISKKDLENSLEEVKVNTEAFKADGNTNARNIPSLDMSASTADKNTELESLPQKQDPISKKDLEKSLEEVKVNTEAFKADGNTNARNIPFLDMSASTPDKKTKLESLGQKQDPISKKDLEKSLEVVKVNTKAFKAVGNTKACTIPFRVMSASTPEKAYPLEKIIEKEEWECLGDLLNLYQGAKVTPDAYPIFVCNRLQKLEDIKDEYEKSRFASVLQYITHLIKYKDKHAFKHKKAVAKIKSAMNHKFPSILEEKFQTMFKESSSQIRLSCEKRKLLINYVLVLSLIVDSYQSDAADIAKDLMTDFKELQKQYKQLGCEVVHNESGLLATLRVPLRRKKRKRECLFFPPDSSTQLHVTQVNLIK